MAAVECLHVEEEEEEEESGSRLDSWDVGELPS